MADILLAIKAGRAFRRENTNTVEPSPVKGAIILTAGEDGLFHFTWKNRTTGVVDEVGPVPTTKTRLIILEGLDSVPVGRLVRQGSAVLWAYVCPQVLLVQPEAFRKLFPYITTAFAESLCSSGCRFETTADLPIQELIAIAQDASPARDDEFVANINRLLEDPESNLVWNTAGAASQPQASTSAQPASATASSACAFIFIYSVIFINRPKQRNRTVDCSRATRPASTLVGR